MRLAKNALITALVSLAMVFAVSAQTLRSPDDNRNLAPTVGSGAAAGGATGLFTVLDGQTLRKGEYTFSIAYSNFDRDPGNVDITEVPVSFNIGLSDHIELFFNTDAWKGIKVNNPQNLSSFYLPNSQLPTGTQPAAIILSPGTGGSAFNRAIFRPAGMPFSQFPFVGGSSGNLGLFFPPFVSGPVFGFPASTLATLGPPRAGGAADNFPGFGSPYGSILPGIVLSTTTITDNNVIARPVTVTVPQVYTVAPTYLPDAPFINRRYGQTAFGTMTFGAKWRFTSPNNPIGIGVAPFYRWNMDKADAFAGFNQLQRGASSGGNRGDIGVTGFFDARAATWANVSANLTYIKNSSVKAQFPTGTFTILDRPDELQYGVGLDFPVNKYFQPIVEYRQTLYVGGRTPNEFENNPLDVIGGFRIYPKRWFGMGFAYRYHANQQEAGDSTFNSNVFRTRRTSILVANAGAGVDNQVILVPFATPDNFAGNLSNVFRNSTDPHGYIVQFFVGRRNARELPPVPRQFIDVASVDLDSVKVVLPCAPGTQSTSNACRDDQTVAVKTAVGPNPDNDVLTYNYTVSGGRIVGQGANVNWDLSGVRPGTYTITSAVDNGCGFCGKTQTKTITVESCSDCKTPCSCPSFSVNGPSGLTDIGGSMTFNASLSGGTQDRATYNWTVSAGTITSGQGTSSITVATTEDMAGQTVTATAVVGGLCAECETTRSASGEIAPKPPIREIIKQDELGDAKPDDIKSRLQNLNLAVQGEPNSSAIIRVSGPAKDRARQIRNVNKAIDFLRLDKSRYRVVDGGDSGSVQIEFYFVPAGVSAPF